MSNQNVDNMASAELTTAVNSISQMRHADQFSSLVSYLTSNIQSIVSTREYYYNELQAYRNNYIVNGIYDIICSDVLVENGSSDFVTIQVDKYPQVQKELEDMFARLNLPSVVASILPELLHYGSYHLRPVLKAGRGIVDIVDNLEPKSVIAITDSKNSPLMYFISNMPTQSRVFDGVSTNGSYQAQQFFGSGKQQFEYLSTRELISFHTDLTFTKLSMPTRLVQQMKAKSPAPFKKIFPSSMKLRTSQSIIWPAIDKLKEVLLLDKLSVYRDIGSILTPTLVGVPVPNSYDPKQLIDIVKQYDALLNSSVTKLNNTQSLELTLQELASVKVIPVVGDRSTPTPIDVGRNAPVSNMDAINDSLGRLLNSLGIPKELFDGSADSKSNLKTNIRYAKKIKRLQKNIIRTLTLLCLLHISQRFPNLNVKYTDINIQLKNNVNVDELENMESQDLLVASVRSAKDLISDMAEVIEKSDYEIDHNIIVEHVRDSFASLGSKYAAAFKKKQPKPSDPAPQDAPANADSLTENSVPTQLPPGENNG